MRIDKQLAETVARAAILEPYRQIETLTTRQFVSWLKNRGIPLQWESLHHLWTIGVLHPVAVLAPALPAAPSVSNRFAELDLGYEVKSFIDLGEHVPPNPPLAPPLELPPELADCLIWHPFQLWLFCWLSRRLAIPMTLDAVLSGPDRYLVASGEYVSRTSGKIVDFANSEQHHSFIRLLALLLSIEPLVHTSVDSRVRVRSGADESFEGYFAWRDSQDGQAWLDATGLSIEDIEQWHGQLAVKASIEDPLAAFRPLVRHASRSKRDRLKGQALQAHNLYDTAEVLRRYVEGYHGRQLPEEDVVRQGARGAAVKQRLYGSPRTGDFDRAVFRRIARDFEVDPQARITWFLEGPTEESFVERLASHLHVDLVQAGVEIMNLNGLGGLASDRLLALLERFRREEVFSIVSIDAERGGKHLHLLSKYADRELLSSGFKVWRPDFEEANFSLPELAKAATKLAADDGVSLSLTAEDIQREMETYRLPAGTAIERLWRQGQFYSGKGKLWGQVLADWTMEHGCPAQLADCPGMRPITTLLMYVLKAQWSHYRSTIERCYVDSEGDVVRRTGE